MRGYRVPVTLALIFVQIGVMPALARAQTSRDQAAADELFKEAIPLMQSGDFAAAADKLKASNELDPAFATLMNLAACYEKLGRVASAWEHYRGAARLAEENGDTRSQEVATQRARALEKARPTLVIKVSREARAIPGLAVSRGGQLLTVDSFDKPIPVDPGEYEVEAVASGHEAFSWRVTAVQGKAVTVEIPELLAIPETTDPRNTRGDTSTTTEATTPSDTSEERPEQESSRRGTRRLVGFTAIGAGGAAIAAGLAVGWSATSRWNDAFDSGLCDKETLGCSIEGQKRTDSARWRANLCNITVVAGVAVAATGAWLLWTSRDRERATQIVPTVGPDRSAGLLILRRL